MVSIEIHPYLSTKLLKSVTPNRQFGELDLQLNTLSPLNYRQEKLYSTRFRYTKKKRVKNRAIFEIKKKKRK